jgi:septum formation protein
MPELTFGAAYALNTMDDVAAEDALHARQDGVGRSLDLVRPRAIGCGHFEHAVRQGYCARTMHRRPDREAPREVDLLRRQRRPGQQRRQHRIGNRGQRLHTIECIIALQMDLVLASASPRRAELLKSAGFQFTIMPAAIDETALPEERPDDHVRRLARGKALAAAALAPGATILGADTVVVVEDKILGKPADAGDARRMLRLLAARRHHVYTGVAVCRLGAIDDAVEVTAVEVTPMTSGEIDWYVASGEPMGKAGAYAIQGLASRFVSRIEGSYSNVVGLPIAVVHRLLSE